MSTFSTMTSSVQPNIFQDALSQRLLLAPPGTSRISSVSGYVSPSALLSCLYQMDPTSAPAIEVRVVIGMAGASSVTYDDHLAYRSICKKFPENVKIRYTPRGRVIHSKVYVWSTQKSPQRGFVGSANFTRQGMGMGNQPQENIMCEVDADQAAKYVEACWNESIDCTNPNVLERVPFIASNAPLTNAWRNTETSIRETDESDYSDRVDSNPFYLYARKTMKPYKATGGINWGINTENRKRTRVNEAYLGVPQKIIDKGFFPSSNTPFLVRCDDGEILIMRLASGRRGKDISTLPHNDELGIYLRNRMKVPLGKLVGVKELLDYGRGHVTITRVAETEYKLDFSQPDTATGLDADLQKLAKLNPYT